MGKRIRTFLIAAVTFGFILAPTLATTVAANPTFTEYALPTSSSYPWEVTSGPDDNVWFTEEGNNKIGKISPAGNITEYTIPTSNANPSDITPGPDGALWFTEAHKIGRVTTSGSFTEYSLGQFSDPSFITTGPDGNLWFTDHLTGKVGKITTSGAITEYSIPTTDAEPAGITTGSDGNLWFTEYANKIGRITTSGRITEYTNLTSGGTPDHIIAGPDGALWFTDTNVDQIGRITTSGVVTEYTVPTPNSDPAGITNGPDGALWFTEVIANKIGRITTTGGISEYSVPTSNSQPRSIATGSDNALWFTEESGNNIGRLNLNPVHQPTNLTAPSPTQNPSLSWDAVSDATSYNIYRNGTKIDSTSNTTYTDTTAPEGTHSYYVTAVDSSGDESDPSNSVDVVVDRTRPVVTVTPVAGSTLSGTETFDITVTDNNPLDPSKNKSDWVYLYDTAGAQKHLGAKVDLSSGSGTFTIDTTQLDNGNANLDVGIVYDAAGNASGTSDNYFRNYTIDN